MAGQSSVLLEEEDEEENPVSMLFGWENNMVMMLAKVCQL